MNLTERMDLLADWRQRLIEDPNRAKIFEQAYYKNRWFTIENIELMFNNVIELFLAPKQLTEWLAKYDLEGAGPKVVGLVFAGNVPMVGFHDLLSVIASGHHCQIKLSSKDELLVKWLLEHLYACGDVHREHYVIVERLQNFDAVIATGSNNSSRYFEQYFGKYPNIIRKNRTGVAVLDGSESGGDLLELGDDLFCYFGLGCRNVSKILVPLGYDLTRLLDALEPFGDLMNHDGYKNSYDYYRSILLLNNTPHLASDFMMIEENEKLFSPIGTLYFEYYKNKTALQEWIDKAGDDIQCIIGKDYLPFGSSQKPKLWDYADGVDTLAFLSQLK